MSDENEPTSPVEQGTGTPIDRIPTNFRDYDRWRRTGELPAKQGEKQAVASAAAEESAPATGEPEAPAKTAPEPDPDDSQETEEPQPARPSSRQRRIDRLTRENAELQQRLQALEQRVPPAPPPAAPTAPVGQGQARPDLKNYSTLEDYAEAIAGWKLDQREAQRKADDEKRAAEAAAQALQDSWAAKEAAAAKVHPDYRGLMDSTEIPVGPGVLAARQALLEDEHGAEILYWLASRPTELKRIAALTPARAVLEIGKLAMSFEALASPENPKPKVSSAPRPPAPISHGAAKTSRSIFDEDFARSDYKGWERERVAELKRK